MGGNKLTGLAAGTLTGDAARYDELSALNDAAVLIDGTNIFTADQPVLSSVEGRDQRFTNSMPTHFLSHPWVKFVKNSIMIQGPSNRIWRGLFCTT